ncbi:c-type cytochrome [Methyloferula stellata]|uniref:c-type cytochrome n=1 Tax=Methyloferula stellata TaxID=876270 RepID=UPI000374A3A1
MLCDPRAAMILAAILVTLPVQGEPARFGFGRAPTPAEIAAFDIDVRPDGQGLPPGHGSVQDGAKIFATTCASCHGEKGETAVPTGAVLVGGQGTLKSAKPVKTIGSYWPYATTLYDYIRRAMPFNAPQSLSNDEVYAVTAYLLSLNKIVPDNAVLDARTLPEVRMPNRDGFKPADWQHGEAVQK